MLGTLRRHRILGDLMLPRILGGLVPLCAVALGVGLGCESVSDAPTPPPARAAQASDGPTAALRPKAGERSGPKPLLRVTARDLKEMARQLDLLILGWSRDQQEKQRPGYRNTVLSGRDSVGTNLNFWLRCEPDAAKWAEVLAAEQQRPEGQAATIEGNCGLWVKAQGQDRQKRTDVAEQVLERIQELRRRY